MQTLPLAQRVVSMLGKDFVLHAFSVSINKFDDNFMVVSFSNISQTMLENIELQEKIIRDKLTNAFNREYFELSYKILIEKYEDGKHHLAIALLDIDHFKKVNDTFGHDIGDTVLIQFVKTIQKYSRQDDILVRWGGEEFILMLKVQTQKDLYRVLEHLRKKIELEKFSGINQLTCSIGGTLYKKGEDILLTVKRADEAVYEAKANGRNQVGIK
jgi:diguanylate cyclase (GGDEF)-like protein